MAHDVVGKGFFGSVRIFCVLVEFIRTFAYPLTFVSLRAQAGATGDSRVKQVSGRLFAPATARSAASAGGCSSTHCLLSGALPRSCAQRPSDQPLYVAGRWVLRARAVRGAVLAIAALCGAQATIAQTALQVEDAQVQNADEAQGAADLPAMSPGGLPEGSVGGMGDVNLYPRRVVLSGSDRSASVGLYNRAGTSGEYDISISDMVMMPDGRLVELAAVTDPALAGKVQVASHLLRWSPRKVVLPANEAQLVRIMVRVPADLPPGEYRSHFSAVSVPPAGEGLTIEQATGGQEGGVGVQILPRFGISIPVIVRVGETSASVGLQDLALLRGAMAAPGTAPGMAQGTTLGLTITREGTRSVFGNIAVMAPGSKVPVAQIKGIGVYTELAQRTIQIPIDPKADPAVYAPGAKLTVIYTDDDYAPGQILAKADLSVR